MITATRLAASLLVLLLAGAGATAVLSPRGRQTRPLEFLGLSFVIGFGLVGLLSVIAMLSGARTGPPLVLALGGIGLAALLWKRPTFARERREGSRRSRAIPLIVAGGITACALACSTHNTGWDHQAFWSLKAFSIHRHGTFRNPDFMSHDRPHMHPRYPLLVPSVHAWIYGSTGTTDGRPVRIAMALFFVASWAVMAAGLRRRTSEEALPWLLCAFLWTPSLMSGWNGGAVSGYADYPLAIFLLLALLKGADWIETGDGAAGVLSGLALACGVQTKDEGFAAAALVAIALPCLAMRYRGWKAGIPACFMVAPALLLGSLWLIQRKALIPDESNVLASSGIQWRWFPEVLGLLGGELVRFKGWALLWPAVAMGLFVRSPHSRTPEALILIVALGLLGVYILAWMAFPTGSAKSIMEFSVNRLLIHVMPALFILAASRLFPPREPRPSTLGATL